VVELVRGIPIPTLDESTWTNEELIKIGNAGELRISALRKEATLRDSQPCAALNQLLV